MSDSSHSRPTTIVRKEFTEKWIQALTLSATMPAAQQIKPLFTDFESLSSRNVGVDPLQAAKRIWDFGQANGLQAILEMAPYRQKSWRFPGDDSFVFEREGEIPEGDYQAWLSGLGFGDQPFERIAIVTQQDWINLLRDESIRLKKSLSGSYPEGSLLRMGCSMRWTEGIWKIEFHNPNWLQLRYEDSFIAERPSMQELDGDLWFAIFHANENLDGPKKLVNPPVIGNDWIHSVERLFPLHQQVLDVGNKQLSLWFQRVWNCVWPVVYRERECLRRPCDLQAIRGELEACFRTAPKLTVWMFVFAKLVCHNQVGSGLGISGDFRDL